jgi:hypothetical protein
MRRPFAALLITAVTLLGSLHAPSAWAQNASEASIQELLEVTQAAKMMESMYSSVEDAMRAGMQQAAAGRPMTDEQRRVLDTLPRRMAQVIREELSWEVMRPGMVQIYRDTLTQDEVNGLINFYRTPAGQALITKMPQIMQRSMLYTQGRMATFGPRIQAAVEQAMREAGLQPGR